MTVIDCDQHLVEPASLWAEHIDPAHRDDALGMADDELGYTWLTWRGRRLQLADVHQPGNTNSNGDLRNRRRRGERAATHYGDTLPAEHTDPAARLAWMDAQNIDEAICFPNYGLLWERTLSADRPAMLANMGAWNRWCTQLPAATGGRLHPVAHVSLADADWLDAQLATLAAAGVHLAMMAPAPVDGRALSHPDLDRGWASFAHHDVTPVFHVADQPRVFDDCWFTDMAARPEAEPIDPDSPDPLAPVLESVFLWVPAALALTDLVLNGTFDRHPDLRLGIIELSSIWVPQYLLMLDGGYDFTARLNSRVPVTLAHRPSDYVLHHVRVASFSYENPARLTEQTGDIFMACSDFPHSEGTATPLADYDRARCVPADRPALFAGNASFLLGR